MKPTRDEIIRTLKALPGVEDTDYIGDWFTAHRGVWRAIVTPSGKLQITCDDATLAEAVAALTPPDDGPVNREWVEGLNSKVEHISPGIFVIGSLRMAFGDDGTLLSVHIWTSGQRLTAPQTKPEFRAMLKLFGVEVVG